MTSTSTRQVNCRLPENLIAALDQQAKLQKLNRTDLIIKLLQEGLKLGSSSVSLYSSQTPIASPELVRYDTRVDSPCLSNQQ